MWWSIAVASVPALQWDWSREHRFLVETEVQLPQQMFLDAENNKSIRVVGWQIQAVIDCSGETQDQKTRHTQVRCRFEDVSLRAGTMRGDAGRAQPVLDEYDRVITGAILELDLRDDGRISKLEIQGVLARNLRTRTRKQTIRLLLRSVAAGLEVHLPTKAMDTWLFRQSQLCQLPTLWGTLAPVDGVVTGVRRSEGVVEMASSAKGLMSPGQSADLVTCETTERAFFTLGHGVARHTWEMYGDLTPGSPGAEGTTTIPFTQRGQLVRLGPKEEPELMATEEFIPSAIPGILSNKAPVRPPR